VTGPLAGERKKSAAVPEANDTAGAQPRRKERTRAAPERVQSCRGVEGGEGVPLALDRHGLSRAEEGPPHLICVPPTCPPANLKKKKTHAPHSLMSLLFLSLLAPVVLGISLDGVVAPPPFRTSVLFYGFDAGFGDNMVLQRAPSVPPRQQQKKKQKTNTDAHISSGLSGLGHLSSSGKGRQQCPRQRQGHWRAQMLHPQP